MSIKRDSVSLFISKIIISGISIVSVSILSRSLDISNYGLYRKWVMGVTLVNGVIGFGFPQAVSFFLPKSKNPIEEKSYLSNIVASILLFGVIFVLLSPLLVEALGLFLKTNILKDNYILYILTIILNNIIIIFPNYFIYKKKRKALVVFTILPSVFYFLALILLIGRSAPLNSYLYLMIIKPGVDFAVAIAFSGRLFYFERLSSRIIREIVRFSIPIGLSTILGTITLYTDKLIVSSMLTVEDFAIFINGAHELPFIGLISGSLFSVITPRFSSYFLNKDYRTLRREWLKAGNTLIPVLFSLSFVLIFFSSTVIEVLFSSKYAAASSVFSLYQTILISRIFLYSTIFVSSGYTKKYLFIAFICAVVNLFLDLFLVKLFGYIGASLATVFSTLLFAYLCVKQIKKITLADFYTDIFPIGNSIKGIFIGVMLITPFYVAKLFTQSLGIQIALGTSAFVVIFVVLSLIISKSMLLTIIKAFKEIRFRFMSYDQNAWKKVKRGK